MDRQEKTPEEVLKETQLRKAYSELWEKYVNSQSELLDIKNKMRDLLNYPKGNPSIMEMIDLLEKRLQILEADSSINYE